MFHAYFSILQSGIVKCKINAIGLDIIQNTMPKHDLTRKFKNSH